MGIVERYRERRERRLSCFNKDYSPDQPRDENGRFGEVSDSEKEDKAKEREELRKEGEKLRAESTRRRTIRSVENEIRNDRVESLSVIGKDGKELFRNCDNLPNSCSFTMEQGAQMADATAIHNHPSGTTFSEQDIQTALSCGIREMRVCHSEGAYILKREFNIGETVPEHYSDFAIHYALALDRYKRDVVDGIYDKTGDADKCNAMVSEYRRTWLKSRSEAFGWSYREEKRR